MDSRKTLIAVGAALVAAGLFWPCLSRLGLGRLPGDINIERPGLHLRIPIATCLVISVLLSLFFWMLRK